MSTDTALTLNHYSTQVPTEQRSDVPKWATRNSSTFYSYSSGRHSHPQDWLLWAFAGFTSVYERALQGELQDGGQGGWWGHCGLQGAYHLLSPAPYSWPLLRLAVSLEEVRGNSVEENSQLSPQEASSPTFFTAPQGSLPSCCAAARMEFHLLSHSEKDDQGPGMWTSKIGQEGKKEGRGEKLMSHFSDSMDMQTIALLL